MATETNNLKTRIKELLMQYTDPKVEHDGLFADTLAQKIIDEIVK